MKRFVILTISPGGNDPRQFGLQLENEDMELTNNCNSLDLIIDKSHIKIDDGLLSFINNGRLTHPDIHKWVIKKGLNSYPLRKPYKIIFSVSVKRNKIKFTLYPFQYKSKSRTGA